VQLYSISEAALILDVDRTTLRRWIRDKQIPVPTPGIVAGRLSKFWTDDELDKVRRYKIAAYWGKGIDRRTGKRAKKKS
jgi:excisionase family DNA binding protein